MVDIPPRSEYDSVSEWVLAVSDELGLRPELVDSILREGGADAASALPSEGGGDRPAAEKLRDLFDHHRSWDLDDHSEHDQIVELHLPEEDRMFQFVFGAYNLSDLSAHEKEAAKGIVADEEGLVLAQDQEVFITAIDEEWTPQSATRIIRRITSEVYDIPLEDLEIVKEVDYAAGDEVTWNEI